jgi:hypothetical protein
LRDPQLLEPNQPTNTNQAQGKCLELSMIPSRRLPLSGGTSN